MNISAIGFCSKTARICILILSATLGSSLLGWGSASFSFPPPTRHLVGIDVQPSDADASCPVIRPSVLQVRSIKSLRR